jgi:hypothetical protein
MVSRFSLVLTVLVGSAAYQCPTLADDEVQFNRDIRPILSRNCFQCHGPDDNHREAGLRFDEEVGIRAAFVPASLDESEGWQRIISEDDDLRMPPPTSAHEVKPAERARIRHWIEQGAEWQGHWSFISPRKPATPAVKNVDQIRNPIDAFIQARLAQENLTPSAEADRERLLRRVTFDLTGLPPTIAEIDAYLGDASEQAYEKVVDRLLASEHYGERMALAWMDAARYGDTSVFHADGVRDMWPWRDWVIHAYNHNLPFDRFLTEQLAGDLLPESTLEQRIATGFLRNNATTDEGGVIAEEFRVEYAVDRVKTTSMVFLGLTMECAQCHDHKYDPISQEDYYRFFAYFNQAADPGMQTRSGNQTPIVEILDQEAVDKIKPTEERLHALREQLQQRSEAAENEFTHWTKVAIEEAASQPTAPQDTTVYLPLDQDSGDTINFTSGEESLEAKIYGDAKWTAGRIGGALTLTGDNVASLGDVGDFEHSDAFSFGAWLKPQGRGTGAPIARMDDAESHRGYDLHLSDGAISVHLIHKWPDNAIKVTTASKLEPNTWQHVFVTYDGSGKAAGISIYVQGIKQDWSVEQDGLSETIRTEKPLFLGRRNPGSPFKGDLDDFRLYARQLTGEEVSSLAAEDGFRTLLAKPRDQWNEEELAELKTYFLESQDEPYRELQRQVRAFEEEVTVAYKPISTVMVMEDVSTPRQTYVLERGSYDAPNKEKPVDPGIPLALNPIPDGVLPNRLGMASWLTHPDHPLTARVAVNRYWYMLFGTGLVKTVEDFGSQGEWPSHPDLLDWLAVDFIEHGWDTKRMLKQIVMSHTYRQSSRMTPELRERDPENRLLTRGPRFRLQGEFIRDNALAASGLLLPRIGGPGVKPYQPPGLWSEVSIDANLRFVQDTGEKLYRRSMYTYWKRSATAPSLTIFDAPTRETCVIRRSRTNTPLQALVTLNDPQFVEAARHLAERVMKSSESNLGARIVLAYRLATGRTPSPEIMETLRAAYHEELSVFQQEPQRAGDLIKVGDSSRDEQLDAVEHAALTIVCSLILNLDETLTRG